MTAMASHRRFVISISTSIAELVPVLVSLNARASYSTPTTYTLNILDSSAKSILGS